MPADPAATAVMAERLTRAGVPSTDQLVVVHVSAGNPFRRWPQPSFAVMVASLASRAGMRVVVTSGPSEREAARLVVDDARGRLAPDERDRVMDLGDFSLAELRGLLSRASLYIGGDSGPLHIAATSTVPIVGVYGRRFPCGPLRGGLHPW